MAWYRLKNKVATIFYCPVAKLKLTASSTKENGWVPEIVEYSGKMTQRISEALKAGAIEVVSAPTEEKLDAQEKFNTTGEGLEDVKGKKGKKKVDVDELESDEVTEKKNLEDMSLEELQAYYEETYEVSSKEIKNFGKLSKEEALEKLLELE